MDEHEANGIVPRDVWKTMGDAGMLCMTVKEENGGLGLDFGFNCVLTEELSYLGSSAGFTLQNDITANYFERLGNDEQREKYLPGMVSGDIITAIAMTEPGAGSDLQGIRTTAKKDGNHLVINGSKTYITNGQNADCVIVVAKTDPERGAKGISLVLRGRRHPRFRARGAISTRSGSTPLTPRNCSSNDCRVPMTNILGAEGMGFVHLMEELPQGTPRHCGRRAGGGAAGVPTKRSHSPRTARPSQDRVRVPEHQVHARRPQGQAASGLGAPRLGGSGSTSRANSPTDEASAAKLWHNRPAVGMLRYRAATSRRGRAT